MRLQIRSSRVRLFTVRAFVIAFAGVRHFVVPQITSAEEPRPTCFAHVLLLLLEMPLAMQFQVMGSFEALLAMVAVEIPLHRVPFHVHVHRTGAFDLLPADLTGGSLLVEIRMDIQIIRIHEGLAANVTNKILHEL